MPPVDSPPPAGFFSGLSAMTAAVVFEDLHLDSLVCRGGTALGPRGKDVSLTTEQLLDCVVQVLWLQ